MAEDGYSLECNETVKKELKKAHRKALFWVIARDDVVHRYLAMHFGRTAGILLCLLTEIQYFFSFDGADIDKRLAQIWSAMAPVYEVRELFDFRYKGLLKEPLPTEE